MSVIGQVLCRWAKFWRQETKKWCATAESFPNKLDIGQLGIICLTTMSVG